MGIFSAIMDKLRNRSGAQGAQEPSRSGAPAAQGQTTQQTTTPPPGSVQSASASSSAAPAAAQPLREVDVDQVLTQLAQHKGGGGNYRQSIVDLLKLLDLDSGLAARKELAEELNVHSGEHGSAEQNIALHRAVMRKLAENGGRVPESMRS